jgi:hypothetical protein
MLYQCQVQVYHEQPVSIDTKAIASQTVAQFPQHNLCWSLNSSHRYIKLGLPQGDKLL